MKKQMFLTVLASALATNVLAGTMGSMEPPNSAWVATLSAGPSWSHGGQTHSILLEPDVLQTYTSDNNSHTSGNVSLFVGAQSVLSPLLLGQLGVEVAGIFNNSQEGDVWVDGNPLLNNYYYSYDINHGRIALKGKLLTSEQYFVQPYVSGSIGASRNRAHNFTVTPKIFEEVPYPGFTSNSKSSFAYTLGAGIEKGFAPQFRGGIGYEFTSLGKASLGLAPGQLVGSGLYSNHLYNHALMFSLTYLA